MLRETSANFTVQNTKVSKDQTCAGDVEEGSLLQGQSCAGDVEEGNLFQSIANAVLSFSLSTHTREFYLSLSYNLKVIDRGY